GGLIENVAVGEDMDRDVNTGIFVRSAGPVLALCYSVWAPVLSSILTYGMAFSIVRNTRMERLECKPYDDRKGIVAVGFMSLCVRHLGMG
ncbi:hypothetical protein P691DRAFT_806358, partial [Macrolepiota fuliginosa MF-IS2]